MNKEILKQENIKVLNKTFQEARDRISEILLDKSLAEEQLIAIDKKVEEAKKKLVEHNELVELSKEKASQFEKEHIDRLKGRELVLLQSIDDLSITVDSLKKAIVRYDSVLKEKDALVFSKVEELEKINSDISKLIKERKDNQPIDSDLQQSILEKREILSNIEKEIEKKIDVLDSINHSIKVSREDLSDIRKESEKVNKRTQEVQSELKKYQSISRDIEVLENRKKILRSETSMRRHDKMVIKERSKKLK